MDLQVDIPTKSKEIYAALCKSIRRCSHEMFFESHPDTHVSADHQRMRYTCSTGYTHRRRGWHTKHDGRGSLHDGSRDPIRHPDCHATPANSNAERSFGGYTCSNRYFPSIAILSSNIHSGSQWQFR